MIFVEKKLLQEMRDEEPVWWMGFMWNSVKIQFSESRNNTSTRKSESADERYLLFNGSNKGIKCLGQNKNEKSGCPFSLFEVYIALGCKSEVSAFIFL